MIMPTRLAVAIAILMGLIVAVPGAVTLTVVQRGLMLDRASASLARGDQVTFVNEDDVLHNIHIYGPGSEDSVDLGLQKPGKLLSYRFDKAGAYRVRCDIHPSVKMAVTVK
jgi:plastocyanin